MDVALSVQSILLYDCNQNCVAVLYLRSISTDAQAAVEGRVFARLQPCFIKRSFMPQNAPMIISFWSQSIAAATLS